MSLSDGITREKIKELQKSSGASMMQCKTMLMRDNALAAISQAQTVDDLKEVLTFLVNRVS